MRSQDVSDNALRLERVLGSMMGVAGMDVSCWRLLSPEWNHSGEVTVAVRRVAPRCNTYLVAVEG